MIVAALVLLLAVTPAAELARIACPSPEAPSGSLSLERGRRLAWRSENDRLTVELWGRDGKTICRKDLSGPSSCQARREAIQSLLDAWTLELSLEAPRAAKRHLSVPAPPATSPPPEPAAEEDASDPPAADSDLDPLAPDRSFRPLRPLTLTATPPPPFSWGPAVVGLGAIAAGVALNVGLSGDSNVNTPTGFLPLLLYVTGAFLVSASVFAAR